MHKPLLALLLLAGCAAQSHVDDYRAYLARPWCSETVKGLT